jgi:vacuolar-type H+-ATPase subunit I/STV1
MPVLENPRHELFAEELATGKSASEAYALAGFRPSRKNASRLRAKEDISARVAELQAVTARSAAITIESICAELDQANQVAKAKGQAAAMVSASALRAKLGGLMVERVEVGGPDAFSEAETIDDVIEAACEQLTAEGYSLDDADKAQLTAMLLRQEDERQEFLASCKAKLVAVKYRNNPIELKHRQDKERRRLLQRQGNGQRLLTNGG